MRPISNIGPVSGQLAGTPPNASLLLPQLTPGLPLIQPFGASNYNPLHPAQTGIPLPNMVQVPQSTIIQGFPNRQLSPTMNILPSGVSSGYTMSANNGPPLIIGNPTYGTPLPPIVAT